MFSSNIKTVYPGNKIIGEGSYKRVVNGTEVRNASYPWGNVEINFEQENITSVNEIVVAIQSPYTNKEFSDLINEIINQVHFYRIGIALPLFAVVIKYPVVTKDYITYKKYIGTDITRVGEQLTDIDIYDQTQTIRTVLLYQKKCDIEGDLRKYIDEHLKKDSNIEYLITLILNDSYILIQKIVESGISHNDYKVENTCYSNHILYGLDWFPKYVVFFDNIIINANDNGIELNMKELQVNTMIFMFLQFCITLVSHLSMYDIRKIINIELLKRYTDKSVIQKMVQYFDRLTHNNIYPSNKTPIVKLKRYVGFCLISLAKTRLPHDDEMHNNLDYYLSIHYPNILETKLLEMIYFALGYTEELQITYASTELKKVTRKSTITVPTEVKIFLSGGSHKSRRKTYRRKPGSKKVKSRKSI